MSNIRLVPAGDAVRAGMNPSAYVTAEAHRAGTPNEKEAGHLTSADEAFTVGIWSADPYAEWVTDHAGYEYTFVLEGQVTLTGEDGAAHTFVAGEAFTIEPGWTGEYRVDEPLLKHFVFYAPGKD